MEIFENKKILITGGFGFIGSHLVKRLLPSHLEMHIITMPDTNKSRLLDEQTQVVAYEADISDTKAVVPIIKSIDPDYVFHLAGYGINSADADYQKAINTNIMGSVNILNALKSTNCKKFINMGTCSEYGNSDSNEGSPPAPINIYGSTKAAATLILHQTAQENDIKIVTLRPFGVFGEGEEPHKIFSYVIINLLKGNDVLLTQCEQYRDYCYVENIIDAMLLACEKSTIENEIFNVASGNSQPLRYYIELIYKMTGSHSKLIYGGMPYRKNELLNPTADIHKIKSLLGFWQRFSLEEGLARTIEWYRRNIDKYVF